MEFSDDLFDDNTDTPKIVTAIIPNNYYKPNVSHKIVIAGKEISSNRKIKSIKILVSDKDKIIDLSQYVKDDTTKVDSNKNTILNKIEDKKERNVERKGASILLWLGIALIIAASIFVYFKFIKKV